MTTKQKPQMFSEKTSSKDSKTVKHPTINKLMKATKTPKLEKPKKSKTELINFEDDDPRMLLSKGTSKRNAISVEEYSKNREGKLVIDLTNDSVFGEKAESSNSKADPKFVCEICVEPMFQNDVFTVKNCGHFYCKDCIVKYIASKLLENITCVKCPVLDCVGKLEPEFCREILPSEVFDRWGNALCEAVILGTEKFYCPYKDCSGMLVDDGREVVKESECPYCWRLFCAQCKVPWHAGIDCGEFQKLGKGEREKEDIMLRNLAKDMNWRRCPSCKFYVQKSSGCLFIRCRCGIEFCYTCGTQVKFSHVCPKCHKDHIPHPHVRAAVPGR